VNVKTISVPSGYFVLEPPALYVPTYVTGLPLSFFAARETEPFEPNLRVPTSVEPTQVPVRFPEEAPFSSFSWLTSIRFIVGSERNAFGWFGVI